jgi:hypothetical protein
MQRTAAEALQALQRFSGETVEYSPTALQLLDEWIDRMQQTGSFSKSAQVMAIAFVGQTFLHRHGGYWASQIRDGKSVLGVVCPVAGSGDQMRFINVVDQVKNRISRGITESLAFFYLNVSVDLRGVS